MQNENTYTTKAGRNSAATRIKDVETADAVPINRLMHKHASKLALSVVRLANAILRDAVPSRDLAPIRHVRSQAARLYIVTGTTDSAVTVMLNKYESSLTNFLYYRY